MYDKELAMALLISSTCLLGIMGTSYLSFRFKPRQLVATIMLLSLIVIALSLAWFTSPSGPLLLTMVILFGCQTIAFTLLYIVVPISGTESETERYLGRLNERMESTLRERRRKVQTKEQTEDNHTQKSDGSK